MTPDVEIEVEGKKMPLKIEMRQLMNVETYEDVLKILQPLVNGYKKWIDEREREIVQTITKPELIEAANTNLDLCRKSLLRMERGLVLLEQPKVLRAFKYANKAILLQQVNGKTPRKAYYTREQAGNTLELVIDQSFEKVMRKMLNLEKQDNSWRAFQIAFFLMSIQSLVEKESIDREIVDLIWFPKRR